MTINVTRAANHAYRYREACYSFFVFISELNWARSKEIEAWFWRVGR